MPTASSRLRPALLALAIGATLTGCGKGAAVTSSTGGPAGKLAPVNVQGAVSVTTRNTTRLGGADAASDAAAVARTVYPGFTPSTRPQTVVLVDQRDWAGALAASALAGSPLGAPLLYSEGAGLPAVSAQTLQAMNPTGATALGGAQVLRIGTTAAVPGGYLVRSLAGSEPSEQAAHVEQLLVHADGGSTPHQVIVLVAGAPRALQMPAAGLAAESGAPILFVTETHVPRPTAAVLASLHRPSIFVIGGSSLVGRHTLGQLRRFGPVTSIAAPAGEGTGAIAGALAVARFTNGTFGWGVKEPGHGLVFASAARPLDGPAAALLSATGDYGPLLLLESAYGIPGALARYLGDIQPAYTPAAPPVKGVYNHGWLIGDERTLSATTQAEIDALLEISPRGESSQETSQVE